MKGREELLTLVAEIRQELAQIAEVARDVVATWHRRPMEAPDREVFVESTALKLHNFYTGCERIFQKVGADLNGALPHGSDWHMRLLRTMAMEIPGIRPALLTEDLVAELADYLRFRHVVRNLYAFDLDEKRMAPLAEGLGALAARFEGEVERFLGYLETLAEGLGAGLS